jgi:hypothetical protein
MGTTRFVTNANNLGLGATLKNGSGGGAPALASATGYPMANTLTKARYVPFVSASGAASPINLDFDQGGDTAVKAIGLHALSVLSGTLGTITISYATAAEGYVPGAWPHTYGTIASSAFSGHRDACVVANATMRYWRISIAHTSAQISLGKVLLAATLTDLGYIYWPGSTETIVRYDTAMVGPAGLPNIQTRPYLGKLWQMTMDTVTGTQLATLQGLAASGDPFSLIDEGSLLEEVMIQGGQISAARKYAAGAAANDVWAASLPLQRLP